MKFWQLSRAIRNLQSCYNFALVLHEKCLACFQPISTPKISHVAEDGDWFGVQTEGNQFADIRSIKKTDLINLM